MYKQQSYGKTQNKKNKNFYHSLMPRVLRNEKYGP